MAENYWQEITLPNGKKFKYDTRRSTAQILEEYNAKRPEGYPEMRMGAGFGLRATLSGASDAMVEATLAKKYPWNTELYTGLGGTRGLSEKAQRMVANRERLFFDPESNTIFTLDEPGITGGDVADVLRPVANLGVEAATALIPQAKAGRLGLAAAGNLAKRSAGVAGAGTAADLAYTTAARFFGGLEDPRSVGEQSADLAGDFLTRFGFETVAGGVSTAVRAGTKKVGRGFSPREKVETGLHQFRSTFGENPPSLGTVTGRGSKVQVAENYLISNYPGTAPKLTAAINSTEDIIRRRMDEVVEGVAPWGGDVVTPTQVGETVIKGVEGAPIPFGRMGAREGGWVETMAATKTRLMEGVDEVFPAHTIVDPTDLKGLMKELLDADVSKENIGHLKVFLQKTVDQKNVTVDDVRKLMNAVGPQASGLAAANNPAASRIYAVAKNTIERAADGNPEAISRLRTYNSIMERQYDELDRILQKVTRANSGVATPVEASKRMYSLFTGGDSRKLEAVLSKLEPDEADFVRRGLLDQLFSTDKVGSAINRWNKMSPEMKNLVAPNGSEWRASLDQISKNTAALELLNRTAGAASTLTQAQQGLGLQALRKAKGAMGGAGGLLGAGAIAGAITGHIPLTQALTMGGVGAGLAGMSMMGEVAKRAVMKGEAALLRSPAYMDWVASATSAFPRVGKKFSTTEAAMDFLISLTPRVAAERRNLSVQSMRDMQRLQQIYLEVLAEAENSGQPDQSATRQGILSPVMAAPQRPDPLAQIPPVDAGRY